MWYIVPLLVPLRFGTWIKWVRSQQKDKTNRSNWKKWECCSKNQDGLVILTLRSISIKAYGKAKLHALLLAPYPYKIMESREEERGENKVKPPLSPPPPLQWNVKCNSNAWDEMNDWDSYSHFPLPSSACPSPLSLSSPLSPVTRPLCLHVHVPSPSTYSPSSPLSLPTPTHKNTRT